jgi:ABC-type branched-subunit amino acid transport system substrate-binding protein
MTSRDSEASVTSTRTYMASAHERQPIKVGWLGTPWDRFKREIALPFEEGTARGLFDRPYEFLFEAETGLPLGSAKDSVDAFHRLVDAGCIVIAGANYSDTAMILAEHANAAKVPLISWCGTERFQGEYCFRLGNGDVGCEPALMVSWLKRNGHRTVAVVSSYSPIGEEYFRYFRQECRRMNLSVAAVEPVSMATSDLAATLDKLRHANADALVWLGYGGLALTGAVREALDRLGWDPPRIMTTAFMQYLFGFEKFEGWVGIDQWCPHNRRTQQFHERFVARYGESPTQWPNAIPGLSYDTAAVIVEGLHRATVLSGWGVKEGIERVRFMPSATGGPNTHIAGGPYDHQLFKGDWLNYGRVRNGNLEFVGIYEPTDDY